MSVCEDLRTSAPKFVRKGISDKMRENLADNKGFEGNNTDCTDLNLAADCLLGKMPESVAAYDDCDWKEWAVDFSNNVYQVMSSTIAAICGLWGKDFSLLTAPAKVVYTRDKGATGQTLDYWYMTAGSENSLDVYMDAKEGSLTDLGSTEADRDYVVIVTCCFDMQDSYENEYEVLWYSSADTDSISELREHRAQHPFLQNDDNSQSNFSWPLVETVYVKKNAHLKLNVYCNHANPEGTAKVRVHQIAMTWIPVYSVEVNS